MRGTEAINVRKEIGRSRANCLVRKDDVASGMTRNSGPYMCSNNWMAIFETAAILEESVIAACLAFFPAVLEYNAITRNSCVNG